MCGWKLAFCSHFATKLLPTSYFLLPTTYRMPAMGFRTILAALLLGVIPPPPLPVRDLPPALQLPIASPSPRVLLLGDHAPRLRSGLSASGSLIMDLESGESLYSYGALVRRPIASLTKLMTALLIVEGHDLSEWVKIPAEVRDVQGNSTHLEPGDYYTVGDLLSALLIGSGNDAAFVLALYHSGSLDAFVWEMNRRAQELGLRDTSYTNTMGLDAANQWSTPRDLAWLTMYLTRFPEILHRLGERGAQIVSRSGKVHRLAHTHALLHADTPIIAGKTGTTAGAKECLLSIVSWGGRRYVVILLHSEDRYGDMRLILRTFKEVLS